jgi:GntR family transcriptional regulator
MFDDPRQSNIIPRHHQLYLSLRELIFDGTFAIGRPMPSEIKLAKRFGMSRVTVRKTLETLQGEGIIERRHGAGTFPISNAVKQDRSARSEPYLQYITTASREYQHDLVEFQHVPTPHFLDSSENAFGKVVLMIVRVAKIEKKPIHVITSYTSASVSDFIAKRDLGNHPTIEILKNSGVEIDNSQLTIGACAAGAFEAAQLGVPISSPLIRSDRVTSTGGRPIDLNIVRSRPDLFRYGFAMDESNGFLRSVLP